MRNFTLLALAACISNSALAEQTVHTTHCSIGERDSQVDWNIAGNITGSNPNVVSELSWRNIRSHQLMCGLTLESQGYFLTTHAEYGLIYSGSNQDSDYNLDNRQGEFSRSLNDSGQGYLLDGEINYGRNFVLFDETSVNLSIGYAGHKQNLKMYNGTQVIGTTSLAGLNSLYQSNWYGPQATIGIKHRIANQLFSADITYHSIDIYSYADWNLRSDLEHPISMSQTGSGKGLKWKLAYDHMLSKESSLQLQLQQMNYSASGIHTFHLASGSNAQQKLNEVNWQSTDLKLIYHSYF